MDTNFEEHANAHIASVFEQSRVSSRGGLPQYPWQTTLLVIESLVTSASPQAIEKLLCIVSKTFSPKINLTESPKMCLLVNAVMSCLLSEKCVQPSCWQEHHAGSNYVRTVPVSETPRFKIFPLRYQTEKPSRPYFLPLQLFCKTGRRQLLLLIQCASRLKTWAAIYQDCVP